MAFVFEDEEEAAGGEWEFEDELEAPRSSLNMPRAQEPTAVDQLLDGLVNSEFKIDPPRLTSGPEAAQFPADDLGIGRRFAIPELSASHEPAQPAPPIPLTAAAPETHPLLPSHGRPPSLSDLVLPPAHAGPTPPLAPSHDTRNLPDWMRALENVGLSAAQGTGDVAATVAGLEREMQRSLPAVDERLEQSMALERERMGDRYALDEPRIRADRAKTMLGAVEASEKTVQTLEDYIKALPEIKPAYPEGSLGRLMEDAASGMARFAPAMGVSALTPAGGFLATYAQVRGNSYRNKKEQGVKDERAWDAAGIEAAISTPLEFGGNLLQLRLIKNSFSQFARATRLSEKATQVLRNFVLGSAGEGIEEVFQQFPEELADIYAKNPNDTAEQITQKAIERYNTIKFWKQTGRAGAVGTIGGAMLGGAGSALAMTQRGQDVSPADREGNEKVTAEVREYLARLMNEQAAAEARNRAQTVKPPEDTGTEAAPPEGASAEPAFEFEEGPSPVVPTMKQIIEEQLGGEPGLSPYDIAIAPKPVPEGKPKAEPEAFKMDTENEAHFQAWLDRTIPEDSRESVESSMRKVMADNPEMVDEGRSWPEIRKLADGVEPQQLPEPEPAKPAAPKPKPQAKPTWKTKTGKDGKTFHALPGKGTVSEDGRGGFQAFDAKGKLIGTGEVVEPFKTLEEARAAVEGGPIRAGSTEQEKAAEPETPKAKEPWEMTRGEWQNEWDKNRAETFDTKNRKSGASASIARIERGKFLNYGVAGEMTSMGRERPDHKQVVEKAIREGKPVPPKVLAEYPDLAKVKQPEAPSAEEQPAGFKSEFSDPAKAQEIKNSIAEGESILASGKSVSGKKLSKAQLASIKRSVENSKAKLDELRIKPEPEAASVKNPFTVEAGKIWDSLSYGQKHGAVSEMGWTTNNGQVSAAGRRIEKSTWAELSQDHRDLIGKYIDKERPDLKEAPKKDQEGAPKDAKIVSEPGAGTLKPTEQKKWLLEEVDTAIKEAPDEQEAKGDKAWILFQVPGDGEFTVFNNKTTLREFKKKAEKFPTTPGPAFKLAGPASTKRSEKRLKGFEGWYYNPYKPRKANLIESPADGGAHGKPKQYYNGGYYSNGAYIVAVPSKPKLKHPVATATKIAEDDQETWQAPDLKKFVDEVAGKKGYEEATIAGEFYYGSDFDSKDDVDVHIKAAHGEDVVLNAEFLDSFLTLHPKAKPFIRQPGADEGPTRYVLFKDGGKVVGIIAGINLDKMPFAPEGINEHFTTPPGVTATKEEEETEAEDAPAGMASAGKFATDFMSAEKAEGPASGSYREMDFPLIEMPELVELAKELMRGRLPRVREWLSKNPGVQGYFTPRGRGKIRLKAKIFEDWKQAQAVLAHEIGHLIDYLPNHVIARGNILGRIASLRGYMKKVMPKTPAGPGELTAEDRKRLKAEAKKLIEAESADKWIDEEIERSMPITPEDVLAIWNATADASMSNPDLYKYVAGLDTAAKKAVVKEALKGQVAAELLRFAKIVREKTGKKIPLTPTEQDIINRYNELINAELKKRELLSEEEITNELKRLSRTWKPFDPQANRKYTKYRYSSVELYADAFSAMVNAPQLARAVAPKFYEAWFAYLDRKTEVKLIYDQIIDTYRQGPDNVANERTRKERESFRRGDEAWAKKVDELPTKDQYARDFVDANHFVIKRVHEIGERNIPAGRNPRYALEDMAYSGSEAEWYMTRAFRDVVRPIEKAGMVIEDFASFMLYRRILAPETELGSRFKVANPFGYNPPTAKAQQKALRERLGEEKWRVLERAAAKYATSRKYVLEKLRGLYPDELINEMQNADNYAKFDVVNYIEKRYGRGTGAKIYRQIGTFADIANPFTATLMKDIAFIKSTNRQHAARSVVDFLRTHFPSEVHRAGRTRGGMVAQPPPTHGQITYLENGKVRAWNVPREIAEIFEENPVLAWKSVKLLRSFGNFWRTIFTEISLPYWLFNVKRDFSRALANLPGAWTANFGREWVKALKPAMKSTFGIPDAVIEEMQKGNMLISVSDIRGARPEDTQLERMLKQWHLRPLSWKEKVVNPFGAAFTYWCNVGRALERTTKVASYTYLKKKFPNMSREEMAHVIRNTGSPDFLRQGRLTPLTNNLFLFSNAMIQGYRGDIEAIKARPLAWTAKRFLRLVTPKLLMLAASMGYLGDDTKKVMEGASEYDKTNYLIVPLALTSTGKSVYLRVPTDETGRFIGGILWKALNYKKPQLLASLFDYTAGQAPTINPTLDILGDAIAYASGLNPYDAFRGRRAINEQAFEAGGKRSHLAFASYIANKSGAHGVHRLMSDDREAVKSELEQVLGIGLKVGPLARFLKITDYGFLEQSRLRRQEVARRRTAESLDFQDVIKKVVKQEELSDDDRAAFNAMAMREVRDKILRGEKIENAKFPVLARIIDRNLTVQLSRRYGNVFLQEMLAAQNAEEKEAVLKYFAELNGQVEKKENAR